MCARYSPSTELCSRRRAIGLAAGVATTGLAGCTAVIPDHAPLPTTADWPMQGGNPQGTYNTTASDAPVDDVSVRWQHSFDDFYPPTHEPLLYDGTLFLTRRQTVALDIQSGESRELDVQFRSVPAVATKTAYRNATLVGLLTQSGGGGPLAGLFPSFGLAGINPAPGLDGGESLRRRWSYPSPPGSVSPWNPDSPAPPVVTGRRVLLGGRWRETSTASFGGLLALDASTGDADWRYTPDTESEYAAPFGRPSVHNGTAYVGSIRHVVHAVDLDTGQEEWTRTVVEDDGASSPHVVATDDAVVAIENEAAIGLAPTDGRVLWRRPFEGYYSGTDQRSTTAADQTLFVPIETENTRLLLAIDTTTGAVRWRTDVGAVGGVPVVANGVVYHSARDRVLALNASDGQIQWEFAPDSDAHTLGTPIIGTGGLYVAGHDAVYALEEGSA